MPKIIIANWKMNPASLAEARELAKASDVEGLIICPPFPFLEEVAATIKKAKLGAQDVFWEEKGAYTGEVSSPELKDLGVKYVIVGHSERRQNLGETDEMAAKKIKAALDAGLTPVLCVGEPQRESGSRNYELGIEKAKEYVKNQLQKDLKNIRNSKFIIHDSLIIAYEPIWAIGTGTPDTPENMLEMAEFIQRGIRNYESGIMNVKVIYGGSVTGQNAENFLKHKEIEGALVGGASLIPEEIQAIIKVARKFN